MGKGGRIVTCGATTGYEAVTDLRYLYSKEITVYGSFMGGSGELLRVLELFKQSRLRPVVDREYALSAAAEAQDQDGEGRALWEARPEALEDKTSPPEESSAP